MESDLAKRLFQAIAARSWNDTVELAHQLAQHEEQKGHARLAKQLANILAEDHQPRRDDYELSGHSLTQAIPHAKDEFSFGVVLESRQCRREMVLAPGVEAKLTRLEKEFFARERLALHGLRHTRHVLFHGAPGAGKTLAAERMASRLGLRFYKVRLDTLISSLFGETAKNLRNLFTFMSEREGVFLLDECDILFAARGRKNDVGEAPRIVSALLQMVEEHMGPSFVVAATNIREALDEAFMRRFEMHVEFGYPGPTEIRRLLDDSLSAFDVSTDVRLEPHAKLLAGRSHALIVEFAKIAAKAAVLRGSKVIEPDDFRRAQDELLVQSGEYGAATKKRISSSRNPVAKGHATKAQRTRRPR